MNLNYIDDAKILAEICQQMTQCDWIAVDTEFLRTQTYYPKLCLIQVQDCQGRTFLIDPIVLPRDAMQPLWQLFTNKKVTKVFHGARQDMEVLYQTSGTLPTPIFDTQVAALFLGYSDCVGFGKLVEALLGKNLEKAQTRTNWSRRPLSPEQLQYAADDVIYLAPLYTKILQQLTPEQCSALQEDFAALQSPKLYTTTPEIAGQKLLENRRMSPKQMAIVQALAAWREQNAQMQNYPRKWVLTDDLIYEMAKRPPQTVQALYKLQNLKASDIRQYGEVWVTQIDYIFEHPETWPEKPPKPPKLNPQQERLALLAQAWTHQVAHDYKIPVNRILNKSQLTKLVLSACTPPHTPKVLIGWRHLLVEKPIRALCQQNACLTLKAGQIKLQLNSEQH